MVAWIRPHMASFRHPGAALSANLHVHGTITVSPPAAYSARHMLIAVRSRSMTTTSRTIHRWHALALIVSRTCTPPKLKEWGCQQRCMARDPQMGQTRAPSLTYLYSIPPHRSYTSRLFLHQSITVPLLRRSLPFVRCFISLLHTLDEYTHYILSTKQILSSKLTCFQNYSLARL